MELKEAPYQNFPIEGWDRAEIYRFFRPYEDPFFQVTAPLRITGARRRCAERGDSFFLHYLYHSLQAIKQETAFCLRFDPTSSEQLRRYAYAHAGCTIALEGGNFRFGVFGKGPIGGTCWAGFVAERCPQRHGFLQCFALAIVYGV